MQDLALVHFDAKGVAGGITREKHMDVHHAVAASSREGKTYPSAS
jgi:hypothetical protein